jgi:hypothetical protein
MKPKYMFTGAALLSGFFFMASYADAFTFRKCGGEKVVWDDPFEMVQNTASIPFGSKKEESLDKAIGRWTGVIGMQNMVSMSSDVTTLPIIFLNDGQNDVAVTPRSEIGGNNGLTVMVRDACIVGGDMEWVEADVMVASDLDFGKVAENVLTATSGRSTFLHEFGHAHGLDHHQRFNNMRTPQPRPLVGGPGETLDVLPDDAQGGRFLYPTPFVEINLFASAHRLKGSPNQVDLNNQGTLSFCSSTGGTLKVNSTGGNNGAIDLTQTERWWLSQSDHAYTGGVQVGQASNTTFTANKAKTKQVTLTIPTYLTTGAYFLYHGVDMLHEIEESREDDNAVREALVIQVNAC